MELTAEANMIGTLPHISVVIPTYNRPGDLSRCLTSLARVCYPRWNVLVIDQSDDEASKEVVLSFRSILPPLTYQHLFMRGTSRARNMGLQLATGEIIACLDDDCTVQPEWLHEVAGAFQRNPRVVVVFGAVKGAKHDERTQFMPSYEVDRERELRSPISVLTEPVMSASMYLSRGALETVGLFDVCLGGGAPFQAAEDWDYCYRALAARNMVIVTPAIAVQHYGAREYAGGAVRHLIRSRAYAEGIVDMKLLRCKQPHGIAFMLVHIARNIVRIRLRNLVTRRGPTNLAWNAFYLCGLIDSFRLKVDRQRGTYVGTVETE